MTARLHSAEAYAGLKGATRRLVRGVGGVEAAAGLTRVGHQRVSRYQDQNTEEFAPVDVIADLEHDLGEPVVTRALAHLAGCDLVPRAVGDALPLARRLSRIAKESADVVSALAEALEDGAIDDADRLTVEAEALQAIAEIHALLAALKRDGRA